MKSDLTKKDQRLSTLFRSLSVASLAGPVGVYSVLGFVNGEVHQKLTLGITLTVAIILTVVNILFKARIRSTVWIVTLGIYFCIQNIMPLLLMVATGSILDEFVLTPLAKSYKEKANINKEMDKRLIPPGS